MENSRTVRNLRPFLILVAIFSLVSVAPLLSRAQPSTSVNIVNNSNRSIRNVYLSHVGADEWGGNQLTSVIQPGQSATVSNFACDQAQIKVIAEDTDGCFLSAVVACGESSTWTIASSTAADCGH